MTYNCPSCDRELDAEAPFCPGCGKPDAGKAAKDLYLIHNPPRSAKEIIAAVKTRQQDRIIDKRISQKGAIIGAVVGPVLILSLVSFTSGIKEGTPEVITHIILGGVVGSFVGRHIAHSFH